jgi:hypothetical protein
VAALADQGLHAVLLRRTLDAPLRQQLGEVLRKLAAQKESLVKEGHLMPDYGT